MSDQDFDEPNLFEFLAGIPTVQALVADRIYEGKIPQHVFDEGRVMDCCVYQRVGSSGRDAGFCSTGGLVPGQYQIDVYATDSVRKTQLARAIRRALVDYRGRMGAVPVQLVTLDNDFDSEEPEPGLERRTQQYTITYVEDSEG